MKVDHLFHNIAGKRDSFEELDHTCAPPRRDNIW